jgi:hypothetical protein
MRRISRLLAIFVAALSVSALAAAAVPEGAWQGKGAVQTGSDSSCRDMDITAKLEGKDLSGKAVAGNSASSLSGSVLSDHELAVTFKEFNFVGVPASFDNGEIKFALQGRRCRYQVLLKKGD